MTRTLLTGGLMAGALAGLVAALLQFILIQPLIVEAELYETGELVLPGLMGVEAHSHAHESATEDAPVSHVHDHDHGDESVLIRAGLTLVSMLLTWWAFALLAGAGLMAFRALSVQPSPGAAVLGLAGFGVFALAPGIGLPPELPGMAAADLQARQVWWILAAGATAIGLFLAGGMRNGVVRLAGLAMIALPHLIGAPHPAEAVPALPPELAAQYVARVLGVNLVGWLVLAAALVRFLPETAGAAAVSQRTAPGTA